MLLTPDVSTDKNAIRQISPKFDSCKYKKRLEKVLLSLMTSRTHLYNTYMKRRGGGESVFYAVFKFYSVIYIYM